MAPSIPVNCARRDHASSRHDFGVYELTRVELLRDLYLWAYERSTREYLAIRQTLAEPDPLRLAYRDVIRQSVRDVVRRPGEDPFDARDGQTRSQRPTGRTSKPSWLRS